MTKTNDKLDEILGAIFFKSNLAKDEAKQAIEAYIKEREKEARIDELTKLKDNFAWGNGIDPYQDRLAKLNRGNKDE